MPVISQQLTEEQNLFVEKSLEGHNVLIKEKARTGKSPVVCKVDESLAKGGKKVGIIYSTGMVCDVFKGKVLNNPSNVYSFLGIGRANTLFDTVVRTATQCKPVSKKLQSLNCVIWEEPSMESACLLELFHEIASTCRKNQPPFGGCQVKKHALLKKV